MKVFASCSSYTLGVLLGMKEAERVITAAVADERHEQAIPAVNALRCLRCLTDHLELRVDGGATQIAKTRSRHFTAALNSTCDVWVTLDDDIDTDVKTLALLLAAVESEEPRVCFAPYLQRGTDGVALVHWPPVTNERRVVDVERGLSGRVRNATHGGFGLVAVNRAAMQAVAAISPSFLDKEGEPFKCAAFLEILTAEGGWLGEDFSFFKRARDAGCRVEALVTGEVIHAGAPLDLSLLAQG